MTSHRSRILNREEERRLLEACNDIRRAHLRPIVIGALDTGMRRGELLALRWGDVDFEHRVIRVFEPKTERARRVSITTRFTQELARLYEQSPKDPAAHVFGRDDVKRSFRAASKDAGLLDVRFHDLRHTARQRGFVEPSQRKGGQR